MQAIDNNVKLTILSIVLLLNFDYALIFKIRGILFDFLVGSTNRKHAKRIHKAQPAKSRFDMKYITGYIKKNDYRKKIRRYLTYYYITLGFLVVQLVLAAVSAIVDFCVFRILLFVLCGIMFIQVFFLFVFNNGVSPSKYAHKRK